MQVCRPAIMINPFRTLLCASCDLAIGLSVQLDFVFKTAKWHHYIETGRLCQQVQNNASIVQ